MNEIGYSIAAVERDTGLSKDVLRVWERRYGFPVPVRGPNGERIYPVAQVQRLRTIKRLMDQGHRPGKLLPASDEALAALGPRHRPPVAGSAGPAAQPGLGELLEMIRCHDAVAFALALQQRLARHGLATFVQDIIAPLVVLVGRAWEDGNIEIYEEHLFTELTKRLLRQSIAAVPQGAAGPRILLTTAPEEHHVLGLLMVESLLVLEGASCVPLGPQVPLPDIARAAAAHRADIVALSFSAAFPKRRIPPLLNQLKAALPAGTALWAGGAGVAGHPATPDVVLLHSLDMLRPALERWRAENSAARGP